MTALNAQSAEANSSYSLTSPYFFAELERFGQRVAAIEGATQLTYAELAQACGDFAQSLTERSGLTRALVFLKAHNDIATLVAYLACQQQAHPVLLLDPNISAEKLTKLQGLFQPNLMIDRGEIACCHLKQLSLAPKLALLLSTSGSTGAAKQVCLSALNLAANAQSICAYLPIQAQDKTITTLPFFYSYGLSVINSHLQAGACIVFNQLSLLSREFWTLFTTQHITSFAGVPYSYEMLLRLRFDTMRLPSLRYFTQAGGKLATEKVSLLAQCAQAKGQQFFVMYGQTEATARMAYLPSERVAYKPSAIGQAIPSGEFLLMDATQHTITASQQEGELYYRGPNVMLGYASELAELSGFETIDVLATGDLAYRDDEGDYVIVGRCKRIIKLFGQRLDLDDIEALLAEHGHPCYCLGNDTKLQVAVKNHTDVNALKTWLSQQLQIHASVIELKSVAVLPLTANGKTDYPAILEVFND
ncbi:MAG: AMP-binding protein [Paraglaciecola sp.]|nr:AMP-binding protein [Paraglaciecola sp.]